MGDKDVREQEREREIGDDGIMNGEGKKTNKKEGTERKMRRT